MLFRMCLLLACCNVMQFDGAKLFAANLILNGDFENNTLTSTQYNLQNFQFDASMSNATSFGAGNEIDIITTGGLGSAPQSGAWKIGIDGDGAGFPYDALSLDLLEAVTDGGFYKLQFYAESITGTSDPHVAAIQIGVSNSDTDFGTLVFSGTPEMDPGWTHFTHIFQSPIDALYLTIRSDPDDTGWNHLDNFSLLPASTGDYNRDGEVNAADYVVWRKTYGNSVLTAGDSAA